MSSRVITIPFSKDTIKSLEAYKTDAQNVYNKAYNELDRQAKQFNQEIDAIPEMQEMALNLAVEKKKLDDYINEQLETGGTQYQLVTTNFDQAMDLLQKLMKESQKLLNAQIENQHYENRG